MSSSYQAQIEAAEGYLAHLRALAEEESRRDELAALEEQEWFTGGYDGSWTGNRRRARIRELRAMMPTPPNDEAPRA